MIKRVAVILKVSSGCGGNSWRWCLNLIPVSSVLWRGCRYFLEGFIDFGLVETMNTNITKVMLQNHVQVIFYVR